MKKIISTKIISDDRNPFPSGELVITSTDSKITFDITGNDPRCFAIDGDDLEDLASFFLYAIEGRK